MRKKESKMNITTTIQIGDENSDDYKSHQLYNCSIVPRIGEYFSIASSRDEDGNYNESGKAEHKFDGIVDHVEYHYQMSGKSSTTYVSTLYVYIYLVPGGPSKD